MRRTGLGLGIVGLSLMLPLSTPSMAQVADHWIDQPQVIIPPARRVRVPIYRTPVELSGVGVHVAIRDGVAASTLDFSLRNPGSQAQEAQLIIPVPDGVAVSRLVYDGVGPEPVAKVLPREEARRIYDSIVASMRDPALVEFVGWNLIRTSAFPIPAGATQKVSLTFEQVLGADGSRVDYVLPRSESLAATDTPWTITFDLRSDRPIATVYSSSHELVTERVGPGHIKGRIAPTSAQNPGSLRLSYVVQTDKESLATTLMAYPDPDHAGNGYWMLLASPPASTNALTPRQPREVTLVLDRSGSMRGEKFTQAISAAKQIVSGLSEGETFNIIDYSDSIESFVKAPATWTTTSAAEAGKYLDSLRANGGTNLHDALLEALRPPPKEGCMPLVLFLTDGLPTVGERNEVKIRDSARAANTFRRRIFSFGVGLDVNSPLLSNLAKSSRGASTFVLPDEDIELAVSQVYRRLTGPSLALPRLDETRDEGSSPRVRDMLPAELPDLFEGDQLVVLGTYSGQAPIALELGGDASGKPRRATITLDPGAASARNAFVPRLWASRKVASLVEEIRQASAEGAGGISDARMKELSEEITRLSIKFGILTEHTSFLAVEPNAALGLPAATRRAAESLRDRAASQDSRMGGVSVAQERDINQKMMQAEAPAQQVGRWVSGDDQRVVQLETVRAIHDLTFFRRGNRWVDSRLAGKEDASPEQTVAFGSPEYAGILATLVSERRQGALAQEGEILIQVGKKAVLVQAP